MKIVDNRNVKLTRFNNGVAKAATERAVIGKKDGADNFCMQVFEVEEQWT